MSTAIATLVLVALTAPAVAAADASTPFDLLDDGSVVVPVTIGGTGSYRFVIDTGSSRTVISSRLWRSLRLPVVASTQVVTPAGRDLAYIVRIDGLSVAGRPGVNVSAAVMPAERYAAGQQVDGLIGQDLLADQVYTIDYEQRVIAWHRQADAIEGVRVPLQVHDNRLLVSLAQHDGDPAPLLLVPDSGSDALVLFAHAGHKLQMTPLEVGMLSSLSGSRPARRVHIDQLIVGSARLPNPHAVLIDSVESGDLMGDGLLPLNVFSRVTFNAAAGYLIVQPRLPVVATAQTLRLSSRPLPACPHRTCSK
jgi:predicted aspartyl protease